MQAPLVLACFERRLEASYLPDSSEIILVASSMVKPSHRVVRPVEAFVDGQCFTVEEVNRTTNDVLLHGRGIFARMKVLDECPDYPHQCKGDRLTLIEELEAQLWEP